MRLYEVLVVAGLSASLLSVGTGCGADGEDQGSTVGDTDPESTGTGDPPATDAQAVAACAEATSEDACWATDVGDLYRCSWVRTLTLTSVDACETTAQFQCLAYVEAGTTPACVGSIDGCEDSKPEDPNTMRIPAYRQTASGDIELVDECGSPGVVGFTLCESGVPGEDVPACACVCEAAP